MWDAVREVKFYEDVAYERESFDEDTRTENENARLSLPLQHNHRIKHRRGRGHQQSRLSNHLRTHAPMAMQEMPENEGK